LVLPFDEMRSIVKEAVLFVLCFVFCLCRAMVIREGPGRLPFYHPMKHRGVNAGDSS